MDKVVKITDTYFVYGAVEDEWVVDDVQEEAEPGDGGNILFCRDFIEI